MSLYGYDDLPESLDDLPESLDDLVVGGKVYSSGLSLGRGRVYGVCTVGPLVVGIEDRRFRT